MDFKQLKTFLHIAELGSFSAASLHLNTAQSSLTRQIQLLERDLNVRLFDRHGRGVRLTVDGDAFVARARKILNEVNGARQAMHKKTGEATGTVRIVLPSDLARAHATELISRVARVMPDVKLSFRTGLSDQAVTWLAQNRADLAVSCHHIKTPHTRSKTIGAEPLVLAVGSGLPAKPFTEDDNGATVNLALISCVPLILPPMGSAIRGVIEEAVAAAGARLNCVVETNCALMALEMAKTGLGHAVVPGSAIGSCIRDSQRFRKIEPGIHRQVQVVQPVDRYLTAAGLYVHDILEEVLTEGFGSRRVRPQLADGIGTMAA